MINLCDNVDPDPAPNLDRDLETRMDKKKKKNVSNDNPQSQAQITKKSYRKLAKRHCELLDSIKRNQEIPKIYLNPERWQRQELSLFHPQTMTYINLPCYLPKNIPNYMLERMKNVLKKTTS